MTDYLETHNYYTLRSRLKAPTFGCHGAKFLSFRLARNLSGRIPDKPE